jgi:predicted DNA-binding transcriptional regulator YafY
MQVLRRHRGTVSGETLARETGVSLRTIRRDIATLQSIGAHIDGEAGVGYILRPDFLLPPLSFTEEEVQALVVGAQWVSRHGDEALALAVQNALAKINGVLTPEMRAELDDNALYIVRKRKEASVLDLAQVRLAMREQRKMHIGYADNNGAISQRTIWPIMLGFVESQRLIAAWCESSGDFCRIRTDRIVTVDLLDERYPRARRQLVKEWREGLPCNQPDNA